MSTNDQLASAVRNDAATSADPAVAAEQTTLIEPLARPLSGAVRVPGDKSISHRSVLFSAMAEGTSHVSGVLDSADVRSSIGAVRALGAEVNLEKRPDGSLAGWLRSFTAGGRHRLRQFRYDGSPAHGRSRAMGHHCRAYRRRLPSPPPDAPDCGPA